MKRLLVCFGLLSTSLLAQDIGVGAMYFPKSFTFFETSVLKKYVDSDRLAGISIFVGGYSTEETLSNYYYYYYSYESTKIGVGTNILYGFSVIFISAGAILCTTSGGDGLITGEGGNDILFNAGLSLRPFNSLPISVGAQFIFDEGLHAGVRMMIIF